MRFNLCNFAVVGVLALFACDPNEKGTEDYVSLGGKLDNSLSSVTVPVFAITNFESNTVDFMDTSGTVLMSTFVGGGGLHGIAFGNNTYVTASSGGPLGMGPEEGRQVAFLNRNGAIARPAIPTKAVAENAFFGDGVFLVTKWDGTELLVDSNGSVIHPGVRLGARPIGAAFGDGVFVVADFDGMVDIINRNGVVLKRNIPAGSGLRNVAFGDGVFVVTASGDDAVTILDKTGRILVAGAPVGRSPRGIAFGDGVFMVSNVIDRSVSIIDKTGSRVVADVSLGSLPKDMAFGNGIFVVANFEDNTVSFLSSRGVRLGNFPVHKVAGKAAPVAVAFGVLVRDELVRGSADTPRSIPDNRTAGITSSLTLAETGSISGVKVDVDITHTWRGDLFVSLVCPDNTRVPLHQGSGGSADNLIQTFDVSACNGKSITGKWSLEVSDRHALDVGTLNKWTLRVR